MGERLENILEEASQPECRIRIKVAYYVGMHDLWLKFVEHFSRKEVRKPWGVEAFHKTTLKPGFPQRAYCAGMKTYLKYLNPTEFVQGVIPQIGQTIEEIEKEENVDGEKKRAVRILKGIQNQIGQTNKYLHTKTNYYGKGTRYRKVPTPSQGTC